MTRSNARGGAMAALQAALTFRVLLALTTSASVTAAVAGPMAYQAARARDEQPVAVTTTTTIAPPVAVPNEVPPPSTTTTSTTTTTTVAPDESTTTTTEAPLGSTGLFFSAAPDHSEPVALAGGLGGVRVWIFVDAPGVASVTFWVDDPTGTRVPVRVAEGPPFDLDPAGVDLRATYGLGRHTVLAELRTTDGRTERRLATFDVVA